ncbi:MAG: chitobiase/beta-hexosaminidase C-terminal domain-containing protein, partial [Acidobacteria bacterium]|nr:chitobiase/beta-hexosaminidase C-terminal domain-containing protein [Acidobacteriota bacterium]
WTIPEPLHFEPTSAELKDDSFDLKIISNEEEIRYTLDGTEPTRTSPLYKDSIKIDKPLTLKARIFRDLIYEGTPVSIEFKSGTIREAEQPVREVKSGLDYKYYEKDWFRIPETGEFDLKPDKTGITAQVNTDNRTKDQAFMFEFSGYLKVPEDGAYTMYLGSSSRTKLFIDNEEIVYNNTYNRKKETSTRIHIQKGMHKIKILYMNAWYQGTGLTFSWEGPGIEKQEVSPEYLFHTE